MIPPKKPITPDTLLGDEDPDEYLVRARCSNCGHREGMTIPKGTPLATFKKPCNNCGCNAWVYTQ